MYTDLAVQIAGVTTEEEEAYLNPSPNPNPTLTSHSGHFET